MSNDLQHQREDMKTVKDMLTHLEKLNGKQSCTVHFEISRRLFKAKMHDGQSVYDHSLTKIKDIKELQKLNMTIHKDLLVDLILQSIPDSYGQFIVNYHKNKIESTLSELLNMLVTAEGTLKSSKGTVLAIYKLRLLKESLLRRRRKNL
ncbi:uncharacterized protein [Elaeis guineensis]|uniref:Uncharacterized protein LOC105051612 n=1 Tax=Elaeis guineensis var. tenera TaxID=51953 RepID=A0A6I9RQN9_ELAGV|nr:uncharacterized protein LOC105051612 [Elaeis guineensis]